MSGFRKRSRDTSSRQLRNGKTDGVQSAAQGHLQGIVKKSQWRDLCPPRRPSTHSCVQPLWLWTPARFEDCRFQGVRNGKFQIANLAKRQISNLLNPVPRYVPLVLSAFPARTTEIISSNIWRLTHRFQKAATSQFANRQGLPCRAMPHGLCSLL